MTVTARVMEFEDRNETKTAEEKEYVSDGVTQNEDEYESKTAQENKDVIEGFTKITKNKNVIEYVTEIEDEYNNRTDEDVTKNVTVLKTNIRLGC